MSEEYGFFGDYGSWQEALDDATGYDADTVFEKVKSSAHKIKAGEAVFERDTILYDESYYSYPLIIYLLHVALSHRNKLKAVEIGGALGSGYYQCRDFLQHLKHVDWSVVEQPHIVEYGQKHFAEPPLSFYYSVKDCVKEKRPHVAVLSGVLQVFEDPYAYLEELFGFGIEYLIFDRVPLYDGHDRLTVQFVPPDIYEASYPIWFFNRDNFLHTFEGRYELVDEMDSFESWDVEGTEIQGYCLIFKKKK